MKACCELHKQDLIMPLLVGSGALLRTAIFPFQTNKAVYLTRTMLFVGYMLNEILAIP